MSADSNYSEIEILRLIAEGDEQAFTVLYNRYWNKVYTYLLRMTKSHEIAEELLYDIFTKLWTGRELITEIQHMDAFLSKVAYNKAISFFRYTASQRKMQQLVAQQMEHARVDDAADKLLDNEARELLQEAIRQLSPQRKLVFTLSREQGLTHEQIARQLNLSTQTVKKTMSNALSTIREFLHKRGMEGAVLLYFYMESKK
ncbi:RNA polymerase sigma-70 factor, ECF subfamily [Chitinophaga jiangningensis]|uniref:RNA polymerase sigma-70 factor, ECF subfamily n=1 Tax=Chitinophaga jiangningensis TaxID=1419482 RepID=A0A1M7CNK8_9BACT|nr:RNA polymerase sigma-70 factor [Chitinophaga jiangningensis]SHL68419.1 RNA polymerase sigma-70 factor, ECF subfamily [Chitinophaga jiangningensis]